MHNTRLSALILALLTPMATHAFEAEVEQARQAAPAHVTDHASYMVWQKDRFVTKVKGSGEFVCLLLSDRYGRFEPSCLNPAAMRSVFPVYEYEAKMLAQGAAPESIAKEIQKKAEAGEFPPPPPGALVYMMSTSNKVYDHSRARLVDVPPHVMLYLPKTDHDSLGLDGSHGLPGVYDEYPHMSVIHMSTEAANPPPAEEANPSSVHAGH